MKSAPLPCFLLLLATALMLGSCAATRTTTTTRTAIEEALLTQTAALTIDAFEIPAGTERTLFLDGANLDVPDKEFIITGIRERLLSAAWREVTAREAADVVVIPRADFAATDDARFFVGLPSIPIPFPTVGTVNTPELAIYKNERQYGRNKMRLLAIRRESGALEFVTAPSANQRQYTRWVLLLFITFRTTDLGEPF